MHSRVHELHRHLGKSPVACTPRRFFLVVSLVSLLLLLLLFASVTHGATQMGVAGFSQNRDSACVFHFIGAITATPRS